MAVLAVAFAALTTGPAQAGADEVEPLFRIRHTPCAFSDPQAATFKSFTINRLARPLRVGDLRDYFQSTAAPFTMAMKTPDVLVCAFVLEASYDGGVTWSVHRTQIVAPSKKFVDTNPENCSTAIPNMQYGSWDTKTEWSAVRVGTRVAKQQLVCTLGYRYLSGTEPQLRYTLTLKYRINPGDPSFRPIEKPAMQLVVCGAGPLTDLGCKRIGPLRPSEFR